MADWSDWYAKEDPTKWVKAAKDGKREELQKLLELTIAPLITLIGTIAGFYYGGERGGRSGTTS